MSVQQENQRRNALAKQQAKVFEQQLALNQGKIDATATFADIMTGTVGEIEGVRDISELGGPAPLQDGRREVPDLNFTGEEPLDVADILSGKTPRAKQGQQAALQAGFLKGGDIANFQMAQNQMLAQSKFDETIATMVDDNGTPIYKMTGITSDPFSGRSVRNWTLNPEANTSQALATDIAEMDKFVDDAFEIIKIAGRTPPLLSSGVPGNKKVRDATSLFGAAKDTFESFGFGGGGEEEAQQSTDFDRQEKLFGVITQYNIARAGADTDQARAGIALVSPSMDKTDEANALLVADFLQNKLMDAEIAKMTVPASTRKKYLDYIRGARDGTLIDTGGSGAVDGPGALESASAAFGRFRDFTMEQIEGIDIPSLPDEEVAAFRAKWDQLQQSALDKVKAGIATVQDYAELTIEEVKQIDQEDVQAWTQQQVDALNKRRKQLGLGVKFILLKAQQANK